MHDEATGRDFDHTPLRRVIGVRGVAATCFNGIVGVGIFGLPALVAGVLGPAAILAYLVCVVLLGLLGLCLAEAGSRVSEAGGMYAYIRAAFGPVPGGVAGIVTVFFNMIVSSAALARFAVDGLASIRPEVGAPLAGTLLLALLYATLAIVNVFGARGGARLATAMAVIKLVPLIALVAVGLFAIRPANLAWPEPPSLPAVAQGSVLLIFAFFGVETGLVTGSETRDPARTIPRALALTLSSIAVLYIGLQLVAQGVLGDALPGEAAPLAATATAIFGPAGATAIVLLAVVSAIGYLVADTLASPRALFALGDAGQLPRVFARVHPRYGTPSVAILTYAGAAFLLAATGTFEGLVILTTSGTLILYLACCLGVLRLRARGVAMAGAPFVVPGGPIVPLAASAIIVGLLATIPLSELRAALVAVVASVAGYALLEWRRRQAAGASSASSP